MKTTDKRAKAYIATLSRETLQAFAFNAFAALNKDDGAWLDDEDDFPSGADVCEELDGALSDAKISIQQIEEWHTQAAKLPALLDLAAAVESAFSADGQFNANTASHGTRELKEMARRALNYSKR